MRQVAALLASVFASVVFLSTSAQAAEGQGMPKYDLAAGQAKYTAQCAACHGADGNSPSPMYPKLAGQFQEYIYKQLKNFKPEGDKKPLRENAIMNGMAAALTEEDMHNIAAYLASGEMKLSSAKDKDTIELGQKIYRGGIADRKVPACASCHGPTGAGIPVEYPRIGGQYQQYVDSQLKAFSSGTRHNNEAMQTIASRLTEADMKAVSDYVAGLR